MSSVRPSVGHPDDNLSRYQWVVTKLCMCIDIVEIWFEIANGHISPIFELSVRPSIFAFPDDYLCKHQWNSPKHGMYIDTVEIWFMDC